MKELLTQSVFFGVVISLLCYEIGLWVKKKTKLAIANPLLIALCLPPFGVLMYLMGRRASFIQP